MDSDIRFKHLCTLATNIAGLPEGSLKDKSRKKMYQIPRAAVSVIARQEGRIHQTVIAEGLNRDRSLVYHYMKQHEADFISYPRYRKMYLEILKAYQEIADARLYFDDEDKLKKHLQDNEIYPCMKHQTTIRVHSRNVYVDVKVSYKNFYTKLELCNLAMNGYDYKYDVI